MYTDKKLVCMDCGTEFVFTAGEQEFYAQKGFIDEPKRCKDCIKARKDKMRKKYTVTCAICGCEEQVPFEPKEDKPVYCRACYTSRK